MFECHACSSCPPLLILGLRPAPQAPSRDSRCCGPRCRDQIPGEDRAGEQNHCHYADPFGVRSIHILILLGLRIPSSSLLHSHQKSNQHLTALTRPPAATQLSFSPKSTALRDPKLSVPRLRGVRL